MRSSLFVPFVLVGYLCGCASNTAIPKVDDNQVARLKTDNNAIVLLNMTFSGTTPTQVLVTLARPNQSGRYEALRSWQPQDSAQLPGQITLAPGQYGIVELKVLDNVNRGLRRSRRREYVAGAMKLEGPLLTKVFDRPIATFSVEAGEVVDIGTIQITDGPTQEALFQRTGSFAVRVGPMPEALLKNLAERSPALARTRIARTMSATHEIQ